MARKLPAKAIMYSRQCSENIRILIAEAKIRRHLTDEGLAEIMGMPLSTFTYRKGNPGRFRMEDIWKLCQILEIPEKQRIGIVVQNENIQGNPF